MKLFGPSKKELRADIKLLRAQFISLQTRMDELTRTVNKDRLHNKREIGRVEAFAKKK